MPTTPDDPDAVDPEAGEATTDAAGRDPVPFDPTGLDLARTIAESVAHTPVLPASRPKKRRPARPRQGRAKRDDPMPLGDALGDLIRQEGWSTELSVHALLARWAELVGPVVAEHTHPETYADRAITVRADSTAWASQLRLMTPQLLARINEQLGQGTITRIWVKGPDAPSWKHGPRSVRDGRGPRDTYG